MGLIERDSSCPGCYHQGVLTTECQVYVEHGNRQHWFIQPVKEKDDLVQCDFCNGITVAEDGDLYDWETGH